MRIRLNWPDGLEEWLEVRTIEIDAGPDNKIFLKMEKNKASLSSDILHVNATDAIVIEPKATNRVNIYFHRPMQ